MKNGRYEVGDVIDDPDLTKWHIVHDVSEGVVRELMFSCALGAPVGPKGEALEYPLLRHFSSDGSLWMTHWRDLAAVVVMADDAAHEVHSIVRHGPVFRLIRLRQQATP